MQHIILYTSNATFRRGCQPKMTAGGFQTFGQFVGSVTLSYDTFARQNCKMKLSM